jgi:tagaturonate reductase
LLGLETVRQVTEHELMAPFVEQLVFDEILPVLDVGEAERTAFAHDTLNRFRNPYLHHKLLTISLNSISKFKVRLLPTIEAHLARDGKLPERIVFAFAALLQFYKGEWQGQRIPLNDDPAMISRLQQLWTSGPGAILCDETLWGQDLSRLTGLPDKVSDYLSRIEAEGIASILKSLNERI